MINVNKPKYSQDECLKSNNILIYAGFTGLKWNYSYSVDNALGGSETAVINLANNLPEHYQVYIAGNVKEEVVTNTHYIHINNLGELVKNTAFHTIIVSRFLDFYENYQNFSAHQTFIWGHDIAMSSCISMTDGALVAKWLSKIDGCICQTDWHRERFISLYPQLKDKISIINNGISIDLFKSKKSKIANRFIYTSCSERGLYRLLELWPAIIENIPDAELCIASYNPFPCNEDEVKMQTIIDAYSNIKHLGKLNKVELYDLMSTSEYWLYPVRFYETSCITAMEMLMSEVICVYYSLAGLVDTVGDYGIRIERGQEIETIVNLTNKRKTELKKRGKKYALSCSWGNRAKKWCELTHLNNDTREKIWVFYPGHYSYTSVVQYLENLAKNGTKIVISNDVDYINKLSPYEITFLLLPFAPEPFVIDFMYKFNTKNISFLQLEPLTLIHHINQITKFFDKHAYLKQYPVYDYSKSNTRILNKLGFVNCIHLPYKCTPEELEFLRNANRHTNDKIYDFGFIYDWRRNNGSKTDPVRPPRRDKIMNFLRNNGFTVNFIAGYGEDRDSELGKCKIILNVHGQINENPNPSPEECSNIFEHIRCDRLLKSGYTILSETSYDLDADFINQYPNLKIINYEDFFNVDIINGALNNVSKKNMIMKQSKNYCFIHSCYLKHKGLTRLDYLVDKIKNTGLIHHLETIYINNIGIPIKENTYGNKFNICNYSDNPALFEIPTINKIRQFSKENENCNILYLHTKGIRFDDADEKENDWINMMLYFLADKFELCLEKLQEGNQCIGCNYCDGRMNNISNPNPKHFSGNFWWSKSQYMSTLPCIIEKTENINPIDAEFWLCKNNPSVYELHNSKINHYNDTYPSAKYQTHGIIINKLTNEYSSAWLGHMEFAHWLSKLLNPSITVDLGVDHGHSTFSFASANKGIVYGIDSFDGDIQSGIRNTFDIVNQLNAEFIKNNYYSNNIKFIKGYFDDVYDNFNETIDILHIDGLHTIEAVSNDYTKWITKTSENAVILFHDVISYPNTVGKLFNSIHQYPKCYFTHSHGLGVVCKNSHILNKILTSSDIPNKDCIIYDSKDNIKIIDGFTFYNELELLKYRLTILNEYVDYFVLVEATHTHVGKDKPLFYQENKELFKEFNHKIIHIVVDDFSHKYPNINIENDEQWINERFQRICINRGLDKLELNDMDVIIITDLDEIPDPKLLKKIKAMEIIVDVNIIELDFYYYNLNCKMDHLWYHSKMISYKKYKELGMSCDQIRGNMTFKIIKNAGWHLSYFGDEKFIKNKIENFGHQEHDNVKNTNEETIKKIIDSQGDIFGRRSAIINIPIESNDNLPPKYDIYLNRFYKPTIQNIEPNARKNIAFFIRHFTERGTEVATYDYANYNETLLGNKSYIIHFSDKGQSKYGLPNMKDSFEKFKSRFEMIELNDMNDMNNMIRKYELDFFYTLAHGEYDVIYQFENKSIWGNCKTIKHCVFNTICPEADYYISISRHLNKKDNTSIPVIPHMINLPDNNTDLRNELDIPNNAIVFGRYGAFNLFDLSITHEAIICFLDVMIDANVYFLFMNTNKFYEHPRIIYLEKNVDLNYKTRFINTCDTMIHARGLGETFGLSIGEFSSRNKPIITCPCGDTEHINILGDKAILYKSKAQLFNIFLNIREIIKQHDDWNCYKDYTPENVMRMFNDIIFDNPQNENYLPKNKNRTICLNMIVKNEAAIIETTLAMLCEKIAFSYWVICDTGSTDDTREIIERFFKQKNIPGELRNDPWENFAVNRTKALNYAFDKSDLVFVFDADDTICGDICIPDDCPADGYYFTMGGNGIQYNRVMLVNNRIKWVYKSVVHEYIECVGKPDPDIVHLLGDYYVKSQRLGDRSKSPSKYLNDATLLATEYEIALQSNDPLHSRYAFYCANSYKDYGDTENAITWYKKTLTLNNWSQEKYICCLQLYKLYESTNRIESGIYYLVESLQHDIERPECIFYLMMHYVSKNMHSVAYMYYMFIKNFIETKYLDLYTALQIQPFLNGKLFIEYDIYDVQIPYYVILLVHCVGKNAIGGDATIAKMYEIILTRKKLVDIPQYIENILHNMQFFIAECKEFIPNFTQLFDSYVAFLDENNYIPDVSTEILQKYMTDNILTVSCKKIQPTNK